MVAALAYSIIISWLTRALELSKASLLVSTAVATLLSEGISILTLLLVGQLLKELGGLPGMTGGIVLILIMLA